jgi:uncharacterized membrane protein YqjE
MYLRRMVPVLLRHLGGYVALFEIEARHAATLIQRRLLLAAIGLISALLSVCLVIVWIVAAAWDGPYRLWVIGGLVAVFAITAIGTIAGAVRDRGGTFDRLKAEWAADRQLIPGLRARTISSEHDG